MLAADEAARLQGKVFAEIELEAAGDFGGNAGRGAVLPRAADHHRDTGEIELPLLADVDLIGQAIAGDVDEKIDVLGSILAVFAGVRDDDEAEME